MSVTIYNSRSLGNCSGLKLMKSLPCGKVIESHSEQEMDTKEKWFNLHKKRCEKCKPCRFHDLICSIPMELYSGTYTKDKYLDNICEYTINHFNWESLSPEQRIEMCHNVFKS